MCIAYHQDHAHQDPQLATKASHLLTEIFSYVLLILLDQKLKWCKVLSENGSSKCYKSPHIWTLLCAGGQAMTNWAAQSFSTYISAYLESTSLFHNIKKAKEACIFNWIFQVSPVTRVKCCYTMCDPQFYCKSVILWQFNFAVWNSHLYW